MKKILITICAIFIAGFAHADTLNVTWHNEDGTTYDTTMCTVGGTLNLPTTPTKRGYTFQGWRNYRPIEYIESTGTQWIDTGIYLTDKHIVDIKFMGTGNFFGTRNAGTYASYGMTGAETISIDLYDSGGTINSGRLQYTIDPNLIYEIHMQNGNRTIKDANGTILGTNTYVTGSFTETYTAPVFTIRWATAEARMPGGTFKLYYFRIADDNGLVRDFIPVLDKNGVACMYDKVSGQFFYNSGTGTFIAGPVIAEQ